MNCTTNTLTLYELLSLSLGVLTLVVIAFTLLYVAQQAKATREQAALVAKSLERAAYIEFEASLFELSKLIVQHPNIRPYLYEKKECPKAGSSDYHLAMSFSIFYLDFFDHVLTTEALTPGGTKWTAAKWKAWMKDMLKTSPVLRLSLSQERHWYHSDLFAMLEEVEVELGEIRSTRT